MSSKFTLHRYPSDEHPEPILIPRPEIEWESKAVFNPSVVHDGKKFVMLYRTYPGILEEAAPRLKRPGYTFKNQISYIGYAESDDGINFTRREDPLIAPSEPYDRFGCEDPRVTKVGDIFYITYTAIDFEINEAKGHSNPRIALATTEDFLTIRKRGIIGPAVASKAAALFPEQVNGDKWALALTANTDDVSSRVMVRYYDSLQNLFESSSEEWDLFLNSTDSTIPPVWWLDRGPELGAAPIKTDRGWLFIFSPEAMAATWTIGAALTELHEPHRLIARTPGYLLQPAAPFERDGLVPNVTFPSGAVIKGDELYVYYGAADTVIGLAICKLNELLDYIESFKGKDYLDSK